MAQITIIIPVYNVEKYLKQCLDSIINQTFKDFECICVNDGSTDNSLQILQEYAKKDNRIKIINQKNSGSSVARNNGIKNANTKYITFIDSDDWITENYLEVLYNKAEETKADIVRASYKFYFQEENSYKSAKIREIHKINNNSDIERLYKGYAGAFVWGKVYKTALIKDNNLLFYEGFTAEDCPFSALVYLYSKEISFIENELLFYRKYNLSITSNTQKQLTDAFFNFITLTKDLQKRNFNQKEVKEFCIDIFLYKLGNLGKRISKKTAEEIYPVAVEHIKFLKGLSSSLGFGYKFKINLFTILLNLFNTFSFKIFRILKNFLKN
ncbi:MAG: glycosyltransferase [Endomicrobiaceae bacterium]|nr:glycosyltransferase [Endomicrobiaceae bacterium]